jgi:hypothetical protein
VKADSIQEIAQAFGLSRLEVMIGNMKIWRNPQSWHKWAQ